MPKSSSGAWWEILIAARELAGDPVALTGAGSDTVLASDLAEAAGIPTKLASGWLGKFVRWGYAARVGVQRGAPGRPRTLYVITRWGMSREVPAKWTLTRSGTRLQKVAANPKRGKGKA